MRVLVACEYSGVTRDAFRRLGHEAFSVDLTEPGEGEFPEFHFIGDAREIMVREAWELLIAHPPCTFLTVAANGWLYHPDDKDLPVAARRPHPSYPNRLADRAEAAALFMDFIDAPIPRIAVENPVGVMSSLYRPPDQIIQPNTFGADASKATCLWLKGLPPLRSTAHVAPRLVEEVVETLPAMILPGFPPPVVIRRRWSNQTDSGQNAETPGADRWKIRSATYPGVGEAMAAQWGPLTMLPDFNEQPLLF